MKSQKIIVILLVILVICALLGIYLFAPIKNNVSSVIKDDVTTNYFGNEVNGDLDGDDVSDRAFIITENTGGSGTFFYITAFLNKNNREILAGKIFLGDRIAPQTTNIEKGVIIVNYADHRPEEPFTTQPSVGKSARFIISKDKLIPLSE